MPPAAAFWFPPGSSTRSKTPEAAIVPSGPTSPLAGESEAGRHSPSNVEHRAPRFAARVVPRKQGTGLWQAGLLLPWTAGRSNAITLAIHGEFGFLPGT